MEAAEKSLSPLFVAAILSGNKDAVHDLLLQWKDRSDVIQWALCLSLSAKQNEIAKMIITESTILFQVTCLTTCLAQRDVEIARLAISCRRIPPIIYWRLLLNSHVESEVAELLLLEPRTLPLTQKARHHPIFRDYWENPQRTLRRLRIKNERLHERAADIFALIVFHSDNLLQ